MCQFVSPDCGFACRAIRRVREHSRSRVGLEARAYLIRVERRLMQFHCDAQKTGTTAEHPIPRVAG